MYCQHHNYTFQLQLCLKIQSMNCPLCLSLDDNSGLLPFYFTVGRYVKVVKIFDCIKKGLAQSSAVQHIYTQPQDLSGIGGGATADNHHLVTHKPSPMVNALLQEFSHSLLYHFGKYKFTFIDKETEAWRG